MDPQIAPNREILRCINCHMNQFRTSTGRCRRCNTSYDFVRFSCIVIPIIPPRSRKWTHTNPRKTGLNGILLGPVLKDLRHRAGLTQEQTSTLSSIPRAYIAKIELGSLSPGPKIVVSFCKALGIRVHDLIFCAESQWEPIVNTEILGYACLLSQDQVVRVIAECNGYINEHNQML